MRRVAVADSLAPVKAELRARGFDVVSLAGGVPDSIDAIIVNGLDDNLLGCQDVISRVPVISARGLSAADAVGEVARRLAARGRVRDGSGKVGVEAPQDRRLHTSTE